MCFSCWGSRHIEPKGSRTGNPFGDRVFLGAATAVAYKTESWGGCGRHLNPGMSSKVATDGPFEAVLGKTRRTEFWRGKGKPEARLSPPGAPSLLGLKSASVFWIVPRWAKSSASGSRKNN